MNVFINLIKRLLVRREIKGQVKTLRKIKALEEIKTLLLPALNISIGL